MNFNGKQEIPVAMAAFCKAANAIQTGKNSNVVKVNVALITSKFDAVVAGHKQVEAFAVGCTCKCPKILYQVSKTLADMKNLIVVLIVAAEQLMLQKACNN